jgi:hypothetical protein
VSGTIGLPDWRDSFHGIRFPQKCRPYPAASVCHFFADFFANNGAFAPIPDLILADVVQSASK